MVPERWRAMTLPTALHTAHVPHKLISGGVGYGGRYVVVNGMHVGRGSVVCGEGLLWVASGSTVRSNAAGVRVAQAAEEKLKRQQLPARL